MCGIDLLLYTVVSALACWQMVEICHHGSIFERQRAWLEAHDEGFFVNLLLCTFCLSNWMGLVSVACVFVVAFGMNNFEYHYLVALPFLGFAAARLANLFNDLGRSICRTPNRHDAELDNLQQLAGGIDVSESPEGPATQL